MPNEKTEQEKFLEGVVEESILDKPLGETPETTAVEPTDEDEEESPKRRRERRLMAKNQELREEAIALNERLKVLAENNNFRGETDASEYLKRVERIYGTDTPEARQATEMLAEAMQGVEERATERALAKFREEQAEATQSVHREERELDSYIEELEDEYNVTFTPQMEKSYFQLMEKLSPKDREGNILNYADPHSVYEVFSEKLSQSKDSRAKTLASRSMTQSTSSQDSKLQDDAMRNILKEAGII